MNPFRSGIVVYHALPFQAIVVPVATGWEVLVGRECESGGVIVQNLGTVRSLRRASRIAIREAVERHAIYNQENAR